MRAPFSKSVLTNENMRSNSQLITKVPFSRPSFSNEDLEVILSGIREVLISGWLTSGKNVDAFERKFAETVGTKWAVALNSCTAALHSVLIALDIGVLDEVIVPSNTFVPTPNTLLYP